MTRKFFAPMIALSLCCVVSLCCAVPLAYGEPKSKGKGGESSAEHKSEGKEGREEPGHESNNEAKKGGANKEANSGKKSPGGAWSEDSHDAPGQSGSSQNHAAAEGAAAGKNKQSQPTGAEGAAAGAAATKNKQPSSSAAEGAAAGAAAENRNSPNATGAQGAAAGAAVAKNKQPNYSGAEGAAAGAAASKNKQPNYSGAQGAAAGAAVAKNNQPNYSGAQGAAAGAAAVRNSFDHPEVYGQQWYGEHPGIWAPAGLAAGAAWTPTAWGTVASTCGYAGGTPVSYNYGANVTCQQGNVMVDGQNVGTAEEFSQQASELASAGVAANVSNTAKWLPLGVFAMVRNENQHPQLILQLAVNKQGVLRGNYTDEVTDHTLPIRGSVDGQTQRAAWIVGDNQNSVMEAGLNNLTQTETRALLHKNGKTERWLLVRLNPPDQAQN